MSLSREREMGNLLMHTSIPTTHASLWFFLYFPFLFSLFLPCSTSSSFVPFFPFFVMSSNVPLQFTVTIIYIVCHDKICHFYPSTAFGSTWVSFQDYPLVCRLPSHYHCTECVGCNTPHFQTKMACLVSYLSLLSLLLYG